MNTFRTIALFILPGWLMSTSTLPFPLQPSAWIKNVNDSLVQGLTMNLQNEKQAILVATNQQRVRRHLSDLKPDAKLMQAAQAYAELMAAKDQMSHTLNGLSLPDKANRVGYSFRQLSENIALNTRLDGRFVVNNQWMESSGHRKNLLTRDVTAIGIGIAGPSKQNRYYYCQLFGTPL
ncbi:CAP domain-containing protein [Spirosoma pollinicola]|uniref:CAP domain-containing protein n=1 Tax=Spirosoma pollinicola TaxID=2057025 RepID=A0A2K8YU24_9BACT|nr:CAP domain-containing protein [Spirosoma pollinicola]AUD01121.1 CAP domain-containing protein [Spirosoma pollinicola]